MTNSTIYEGVYTETTIEEETTMFGKAKDMFKSITGKGIELAKKAWAKVEKYMANDVTVAVACAGVGAVATSTGIAAIMGSVCMIAAIMGLLQCFGFANYTYRDYLKMTLMTGSIAFALPLVALAAAVLAMFVAEYLVLGLASIALIFFA